MTHVDRVLAELSDAAKEALLSPLIFMPSAGEYLRRRGLIEPARKLSRHYTQYKLTDLGRCVKAALKELAEAEKALLPRPAFEPPTATELVEEARNLLNQPLRPGHILMTQQDWEDLVAWGAEGEVDKP